MKTALTLLVTLAILTGCQASTAGKRTVGYEGTTKLEVEYKADGTPHFTIEIDSHKTNVQTATIVPPTNAHEAPTISFTDDGMQTAGGAAWAPAVVTVIQRNAPWLYGLGSFLAVVAVLFMVIPFLRALPGATGIAVGLGGLSGLMFLLPSFIERWGAPVSLGLFVGALVLTALWVLIKVRKRRIDTAVATAVVAKQPEVATRIRTDNDKEYASVLGRVRAAADAAGQPPVVVVAPGTVPTQPTPPGTD